MMNLSYILFRGNMVILIDIHRDVLTNILRLVDDPTNRKVCKEFKDIIDKKIIYDIRISNKNPDCQPPKCFQIRAVFDLSYFVDNSLNSHIGYVYSLDLSGTNITDKDIPILSNVHTLNLSYTKVKDVSKLGNVHTLKLSGTNVEDVSMLGNVHTLYLSGTNVEDVSMLGNVHTLYLSNTNVIDVSMLGNVEKLSLSRTKIKDVSMLGNIKYLSVACCKNIADFSALINVPTLNLSGTKVYDVSIFNNVDTLYLRYCKNIKGLSTLTNVNCIDISHSKIDIADFPQTPNRKITTSMRGKKVYRKN